MKIYHLIVSFFIYPSSKYPLTPALLPSPLPQLKVSETRKIYFGLCATPSHGSRLIQSWKSRKVAWDPSEPWRGSATPPQKKKKPPMISVLNVYDTAHAFLSISDHRGSISQLLTVQTLVLDAWV